MSKDISLNPFSPPTSPLHDTVAPGTAFSIEEALARGYDFSIGDVIQEAWQRISGIKGMVFGGLVVYSVAVQSVSFVLGLLLGLVGTATGTTDTVGLLVLQLVIGILAGTVGYPFLAGINMMGIRRAADQPVSFNEMFSHFGRFLPLLCTGLLMTLLVYLGMFLLVIPGIYLSIAYMLAIPLTIERNLSPWQALEASRRAISQHWFKVFGLFTVLGLLMMVSIIPLGIGLVWTVPMTIVSVGILYRTIFGVLPPPN